MTLGGGVGRAVVIDVADWIEDESFATYPEGARSKRAYFPSDVAPDFIRRSRRHLFKRSDKRYPEQFWGEIVASYLGEMLSAPVPLAYPAVDTRRDTVGALIEWFYEDREASFVQGGNFMQQLIVDFDRKRGTQHNFRSVRTLCRVFQRIRGLDAGWMGAWVDALTFDALIGNTDRHQDNWGFLFFAEDGKVRTALSPWYDNGTSLGHERWEEHVAEWRDEHYLRYVRRGCHHLRWMESSPARCGFFEMPRLLIELDPAARDRMRLLIDRLDFARLEHFLAECRTLQHPVPLTPWRSQFMVRLIKLRRDLLLKETA